MGEGEGQGEREGTGQLRWKKDKDESKEREILMEGAIMGIVKSVSRDIPRNPQR